MGGKIPNKAQLWAGLAEGFNATVSADGLRPLGKQVNPG